MSPSSKYLQNLNEQQVFAVTHTDGPMLILAGAGSGKTRTLTYKIAYLIDQNLSRPERILAVTFTNKAAEEMRGRVEQLVTDLATAPLICTFHSFALRVLRRHADLVDYGSDFTISDVDDQKAVLKTVYQELKLNSSDLPIRKVQAVISRAKNNKQGPEEYLRYSYDFDRDLIFQVFTAYQRSLKQSNSMDFDDLILLAGRLFKERLEVRERYGDWYRYLLIDEYQDTNAPQYDLIKYLACLHQNISAVGDEDQSIYGFRGADVGNILRFESDFAGARVVKLEQNYRSTQNILDAAISVVSNNVHRKGKVLWTREIAGELIDLYVARNAREEAFFVSHTIQQYLQQGETRPAAVLYRANFLSRQFEEAFRQLRIPYRLVGGVSFYHRKEIKDALSYLRVIQNTQDNISLLRVINQPARGLGRVTLDRLHQMARASSSSLWEAIGEALEQSTFSAKIHLALERFHSLIRDCRKFLELPLPLALEKILQASGYRQALREEDTEEAYNRILNLEELVTVAREYADQGQALQEFLDHAALRTDADDYDASEAVSLMTLHNAKGLEFPIVFLVGCEEGLFPHSRSVAEDDLEEERRLCYVGLTRAQKKLYLSYSRTPRFFGRDSDGINLPSQFLTEIPPHLIQVSSGMYESFVFGDSSGRMAADSSSSPRGSQRVYTGQTSDSVASVRKFLDELSRKKAQSKTGFVSGARILHKKYGHGRILQVQDTGDDLKITVKFPGIGVKKMLQSYAGLKLI